LAFLLGEAVWISVNNLKLCDSFDTGMKAPVWQNTNFDAGLYDITGFF